jgi:hypothetical protein
MLGATAVVAVAAATDLYKPFVAFGLSTDAALASFIAAKQVSHQQWKVKLM